ncbi:MAG: hypothetical protein GY870_15165 [archaeon]|nr:hypothetical protein [archaeon]
MSFNDDFQDEKYDQRHNNSYDQGYNERYDDRHETQNLNDNYEDKREFIFLFYNRVVPVLLVGMLIWYGSTVYFSGVVPGVPPIILTNLPLVILSIIGYIFIWIITSVLAYKRRNVEAMFSFFIGAFITGVMSSPLITSAAIYLNSTKMAQEIFITASLLGVISTSGALLAGMLFKYNISHRLIWSAFIGMMMLTFVEFFIFSFTLDYSGPYSLMACIFSGLFLGFLYVMILYDGAYLKEYVRESWMLAVLAIFFDMINVIVRLFYILVRILGDN